MKRLRVVVVPFVLGCLSAAGAWAEEAAKGLPFGVRSIKIEVAGGYAGDAVKEENASLNESEESCKDFTLTESEVSQFFANVRQASPSEYLHDLKASSCYVSGTLVAKDGTEGTWKIDRSKRGFVMLAAGEPGFYVCEGCKGSSFYD